MDLRFLIEQAIVRHVNFQLIKCLLLGSPGFVKDDFFEFLNLEAVRREERVSCNGVGGSVVVLAAVPSPSGRSVLTLISAPLGASLGLWFR